ncbi:MAG: hypothetical protein ACRCTI_05655 [Beijerinckiaceae bacterium]
MGAGATLGRAAFYALAPVAIVAPAGAADTPGAPPKTDPQWTFEVNPEFRFVSWTGKRGFPTVVVPAGFARGRGFEFTTPLGLQLTGHAPGQWKFELLVRGNSVRSSQRTPGLQGSHFSLSDTVVTGTFTYEGFGAFKPFASLALNLPTGDRRLSLGGSRSRMDSDIVDVGAFGEGRNIGPTIGANVALTEQWLLSLSAGRTVRGRFLQGVTDETGLTTLTLQQPGAESALNGSINYNAGAFSASAAVAFALPESDRIDRAFSVRQGRRMNISLDASYTWSPTHATKAQFALSRSGRNKVIDNVALAIAVEPFNSNSIRYTASIDHTITMGAWKFSGIANIMYRDRNQWRPIDQQFVQAKWKFGSGAQVAYDLSEKVTLTGRLERFWVREASQSEKFVGGAFTAGLAIPRVTSHGWAGGLSGSVKF